MLCAEDRIDTAFFPYGPGSPDAMIHNDHLATPQRMTDSSGTVVWSADYKPFGEATVNPSSTITNNLRFPGQYYDVETGLHYNYFRDYNPVIGKYIEGDPVGLSGGINLYDYARQNPLSFTDFNGLEPCEQISDWNEISVLSGGGSKSFCGPSEMRNKWKQSGAQVDDNLMNCMCYWKKAGVERVYKKRCFTEQAMFKCKKKDKCGKETSYTKTKTRENSETGEWVVPEYPVIADFNTVFKTKGTWTDGGCWCLNPDGNLQ